MTIISAILSILSRFWKPIAAILGGIWLRRDAVKDATAKADLQAHERMNHAPDTDGLSDDERVERLRELGRRLGG